jgi:hypothetical protein
MNWLSSNEARFGNKIFAYFFLVYLHRQTGAKCCASEWIGNEIFELPLPIGRNHTVNYLSINLEHLTNRNTGPLENIRQLEKLSKQTGMPIDVRGTFQYNTDSFQSDAKELFLTTYQLNLEYKNFYKRLMMQWSSNESHYIAIHYRAGDYLNYDRHPLFWTPPFDTVIELARTLNNKFPTAKLFLASDSSAHKEHFLEAFPGQAIANQLSFAHTNEELIADFLMLMHANLVVAANSSFSIAASLMNTRSGSFLRPLNRTGQYVLFDPWRAPVLLSC